MRVLSEHTLPEGTKATVFSWNGKYILKLEKGLFEQTYKIPEWDVSGQKEVETLLINEAFLSQVEAIFDSMSLNLSPLLG